MDEKTTNEKCKEILASNLDEDLKIELIALLKKTEATAAQSIVYIPYYHPDPDPWWKKITWTSNGAGGWMNNNNAPNTPVTTAG